MSDEAPPAKEFDQVKIKSLRIKTGVVKRTGKEKVMYRKEADKEKAKVEKMKAEGKDEADIKKMTEVRNGCTHVHLQGGSVPHTQSFVDFEFGNSVMLTRWSANSARFAAAQAESGRSAKFHNCETKPRSTTYRPTL